MISFGLPMICCMPSFYHPVVIIKSSVIEKTELLHIIKGVSSKWIGTQLPSAKGLHLNEIIMFVLFICNSIYTNFHVASSTLSMTQKNLCHLNQESDRKHQPVLKSLNKKIRSVMS